MLARFYSIGLGRFLSVDPSRRSVSSSNPQTWNRYNYAANSPIQNIDSMGEFPHGFHGIQSKHVLIWVNQGVAFWTSEEIKTIARRTDRLDRLLSTTNALFSPDLHFGDTVQINYLADRAIEAYSRGERKLGNEYTGDALHLAFDSDGGAHSGTSWPEHLVRGIAGVVRPSANPDSHYSPGWIFRYVQGLRNMIAVARYIVSGGEGGDYRKHLPQGVPVLEHNMHGALPNRVLETADGYANRGLGVFIDGVCYRNCAR